MMSRQHHLLLFLAGISQWLLWPCQAWTPPTSTSRSQRDRASSAVWRERNIGQTLRISPFTSFPSLAIKGRRQRSARGLFLASSPPPAFPSLTWPWAAKTKTNNVVSSAAAETVQQMLQAYNQGDWDQALSFFDDDDDDDAALVWDDVTFSSPCTSKEELERRWRLQRDAEVGHTVVMDDMAVGRASSSDSNNKVGVQFHYETQNGGNPVPLGRGCAFFELNADGTRLRKVFWTIESQAKTGETSLKVGRRASEFINSMKRVSGEDEEEEEFRTNTTPVSSPMKGLEDKGKTLTATERYFAAWNRRDMDAAIQLFADDVTYDDTAFPKPFAGKQALKKHLELCAALFPPSFSFVVDDIVDGGDKLCAKWHVENDGELLPFSRGCSFATLNQAGKILVGTDYLEPAVFKPSGFNLFVASIQTKIQQEPARLVPLMTWLAYIVVVFFSDGILPGANALQLEARTWEEVFDLSLNFFLVSPLLHLPFSPVVHPMLEGVFNLLLSWAAMFAGLLSDDRRDKPNLFPMLPAVVGMQLLTSAFYLPYLTMRTTETRSNVTQQDLSPEAQVCERRVLGPTMGTVGIASIVWAFLGRQDEFGGLTERWTSFGELLSIDRVGSSFIVDLVIFGLFQFWLIDDDMKRRGYIPNDNSQRYVNLVWLAKYVPCFGLAAYLALRPPLPASAGNNE